MGEFILFSSISIHSAHMRYANSDAPDADVRLIREYELVMWGMGKCGARIIM